MTQKWCPQCQRAVIPRADHPTLVTLDSLACGCLMGVFTLVFLTVLVGVLLHGHVSAGWALYIVIMSLAAGIVLTWARQRRHTDQRGVCPVCGIRL